VDVLGGRDQLARVADRAEALVRAAGPAIERGQNLLGVRDGETARFGAVNVERRCTYIRDVFRWGGGKGDKGGNGTGRHLSEGAKCLEALVQQGT